MTYLEQELAKDALTFWDETLEAQVNFSGTVELPFLFKKIEEANPTKILDIGTGNGSFLTRIAEKYPDIKFVGIDLNRGLLDLFDKRIAAKKLKNIELREASFDSKGLAEKFEFIIERYTLAHITDRTGFCHGVFQSLKSGGRFYSFEGSFSTALGIASGLWKEVIEKYITVITHWGSQTDIGLSIASSLKSVGFTNVDSSIRLSTPEIAGDGALKNGTLKTLAMFHKQFPELVSSSFIEKVERDLLNYDRANILPCIANVQTEAFR